MDKIGLIYLKQNTSWASCISILDNLIAAYKATEKEIFELPVEDSSVEASIAIGTTIIQKKINKIIFLDHRHFPIFLLNYFIAENYAPDIYIHIYGDFFLNSYKWFGVDQIMRQLKIKFICASEAQTNFLKNLLREPNQSIKIPFPIHVNNSPDPMTKELIRKKYNVQNKIVLIYTGRISLQKNVMYILQDFLKIANIVSDAEIFFAGPFDDIGIPYLGLERLPNSSKTRFFEEIEKCNPEIKSRIHYLGNLNQNDLSEVYQMADLYINYSTHNDEDFGMAPAEAIYSGLPALLTNWGGFVDFHTNFPNRITLVNVEKKKFHFGPQSNSSKILLNKILNLKIASYSKNENDYCSINAVSLKIKKCLENDINIFSGFSESFEQLAYISLNKSPFSLDNTNYIDEYYKYYQCYINPTL